MKKKIDKIIENIEKQIVNNFKKAKALASGPLYVPALNSDVKRDSLRIEITELNVRQDPPVDLRQRVSFSHNIRNIGKNVITLNTFLQGYYRFMVDDDMIGIALYIVIEYTMNSSDYHESIKKCNLEDAYSIYYKSLSNIQELGKLRIPSDYILLPGKWTERYGEIYEINPEDS